MQRTHRARTGRLCLRRGPEDRPDRLGLVAAESAQPATVRRIISWLRVRVIASCLLAILCLPSWAQHEPSIPWPISGSGEPRQGFVRLVSRSNRPGAVNAIAICPKSRNRQQRTPGSSLLPASCSSGTGRSGHDPKHGRVNGNCATRLLGTGHPTRWRIPCGRIPGMGRVPRCYRAACNCRIL